MPIHDVQANPGQVLPDTRPADLTAEETEAAADQETREEQEEPEPAADSDLAATDLEAAANPAPDPVTSDPAPDPEPQPDPAADLADDPEPQPEEQYAWHCNRCGLGFHNYDKKTRDEVRGGTRGVRQQTPLFRCRKCNSLRTSMKNDGSYYDVMTMSAENAQKYFLEARAMTPAEKQHFIAQHSVTNYEGKESKNGSEASLSRYQFGNPGVILLNRFCKTHCRKTSKSILSWVQCTVCILMSKTISNPMDGKQTNAFSTEQKLPLPTPQLRHPHHSKHSRIEVMHWSSNPNTQLQCVHISFANKFKPSFKYDVQSLN